MKKFLLIVCLGVLGMSLFAQEKGDMVVSGSISWTSNSVKQKAGSQSEVTKGSRSFQILPEFHYFVCDKVAVGLGIGYALQKDPNGNTNTQNDDQLFNKTGLFLIQPMASYYVSLCEKFYYVPRFYIGFGVGKYKVETDANNTSETDISRFNVGLSLLNFEFKPCEKIGVSFNAGDLRYELSRAKQDSDNKVTRRDFSLGLNLGATVGFNYYF